MLIGYLDNSF